MPGNFLREKDGTRTEMTKFSDIQNKDGVSLGCAACRPEPGKYVAVNSSLCCVACGANMNRQPPPEVPVHKSFTFTIQRSDNPAMELLQLLSECFNAHKDMDKNQIQGVLAFLNNLYGEKA